MYRPCNPKTCLSRISRIKAHHGVHDTQNPGVKPLNHFIWPLINQSRAKTFQLSYLCKYLDISIDIWPPIESDIHIQLGVDANICIRSDTDPPICRYWDPVASPKFGFTLCCIRYACKNGPWRTMENHNGLRLPDTN